MLKFEIEIVELQRPRHNQTFQTETLLLTSDIKREQRHFLRQTVLVITELQVHSCHNCFTLILFLKSMDLTEVVITFFANLLSKMKKATLHYCITKSYITSCEMFCLKKTKPRPRHRAAKIEMRPESYKNVSQLRHSKPKLLSVTNLKEQNVPSHLQLEPFLESAFQQLQLHGLSLQRSRHIAADNQKTRLLTPCTPTLYLISR